MFGQHNPVSFILTVFGIQITGYAPEAFKITPNAQLSSHRSGADGAVVVMHMHDKSALLTFTLLIASPAHRQLLALVNANRAAPVIGAFEAVDMVNGIRHTSPQAWLVQQPDESIGPEATEYEWQIGLSNWTRTPS